MKKHILLATLILSLGVSSCQASKPTTKATDDKTLKTEKRDMGNFSQLSILSNCDIIFTQSHQYKVEITANSETLSQITTENKNGVLTIKEAQSLRKIAGVHIYQSLPSADKVSIHISAPSLKSIQLMGNGDFDAATAIDQKDALNIQLIGNGDIKIPTIKCPILTTILAGNGDMNIDNADTQSLTISLAGNGDIDFKRTKAANTVSVSVAGTGDVNLDNIDAQTVSCSVAGTGDATLKGKTVQYTKAIVGYGSIHDKNLHAQNTNTTDVRKSADTQYQPASGINERP